jgi:hypothetical protein
MMAFRSYIILLIFSLVAPLSGQIVTVRANFESDSALLGDQLKFTISAESASDVQVGLPVYSDTLSKEIEILRVSDIDTSYNENRRIISQEYLVTSFEPGWNTIPPQPVTFRTEGLSDTVYTTALLLTVLAPDVDPEQPIKPIKPPMNTPVSLAEILPWLLIGLGGMLLLALIVFLVRKHLKKAKHPELFTDKPVEPAHVIAFRDLKKLEEDELPKKGMIKEYYSRLTEIIRIYITRQFSIHAMESTTAEILEAFAIQNTGDRKLVETLESLLLLADLVKFAKEDPTREENEKHLRNAVDYVERTYRMFETEEDAEAEELKDLPEKSKVEPVKMEENNG